MTRVKKDDVFRDVESFDVIRNKQTVLHFEPEDINGKTRIEIEKIIGQRVGSDIYHYSMKLKNIAVRKSGKIRGLFITPEQKKGIKDENMDMRILTNKLENLFAQIQNNSGNLSVQELLKLKDEQIQTLKLHYEERIKDLKEENRVLRREIEKADTNSGGIDISSLLPLISSFLGKKKLPIGLADAHAPADEQGSMPQELKKRIEQIDFSKLPAEQTSQIIKLFDMYSEKLPKKTLEEIT